MTNDLSRGHIFCCGCMSIESAAKVVAVSSLVYAFVTLNIVGCIFNILLVVCVFSDRRQRGMALAFIIWQSVWIVILFFLFIWSIVILATIDSLLKNDPYDWCTPKYNHMNGYYNDCTEARKEYRTFGAVLLTVTLLSIFFAIYCLLVIIIFYRNIDNPVMCPQPANVYVIPSQQGVAVPPMQYPVYQQQQQQPYSVGQQQQQQQQFQPGVPPVYQQYDNTGFQPQPQQYLAGGLQPQMALNSQNLKM